VLFELYVFAAFEPLFGEDSQIETAVKSFNFIMAADDILHEFNNLPLVWNMARQDVKLRYVRSVLGPLWITITMAIYVVGIGFVFGGLFGASVREVVPWIAIGMIIWILLSNILNEASVVLVQHRALLLQAKLSVSMFVLLVLLRNAIISAHHMAIVPSFTRYATLARPANLLLQNAILPSLLSTMVTKRARSSI
jgi:ABC-type polysaccharide/polyol phosphate export permease